MSKHISKFKSELNRLATCQPTTARILFERAPQEFIRAIIDAAWKKVTGKLNLSQKDIDDIRGCSLHYNAVEESGAFRDTNLLPPLWHPSPCNIRRAYLGRCCLDSMFMV